MRKRENKEDKKKERKKERKGYKEGGKENTDREVNVIRRRDGKKEEG